MKKQIKILVVFLVIIFNLQARVLAGDSIGLSISCTIPAIPGVNAPLNEETNIAPKALEEKETQTSSPNLETQEEEPVFIEELQETQLAQGKAASFTKIIYSR
jgi:hypothetical protein